MIQPAQGYRAAIDPVLLAAAVPARAGEAVLDLGTGAGAAALCLAARIPGCRITGLELQPELARLASENAVLNALEDRFTVLCGDLAHPPAALGEGYHHVMANPPYLPPERADPAARGDPATVEGAASLAEWIAVAAARGRAGASLAFVHRADRLDEILSHVRGVAGDILVAPLWPRAGEAARRVLVRARKGVANPTRLGPGLVLHEADGAYTAAAQAILRDAAPFEP